MEYKFIKTIKDIISVSTTQAYVFGRLLSLSYYRGESGKVDKISINTHEDSRIIESIIRKLINDISEEENKILERV